MNIDLTGLSADSVDAVEELVSNLKIRSKMLAKLDGHLIPSSQQNEIDSAPINSGDKIFISYSHKDLHYLNRLLVHLVPLQNEGIIETFVDLQIKVGEKWREETGHNRGNQ